MTEKSDDDLKTELLAFEHMSGKISSYPFIVETTLHKAQKMKSNNSVNITKNGYYTFYLKRKGSIKVGGKEIVALNTKADDEGYGIIGLKKGNHALETT